MMASQRDIERRLVDAERRLVDAERRLVDAERRLAILERLADERLNAPAKKPPARRVAQPKPKDAK